MLVDLSPLAVLAVPLATNSGLAPPLVISGGIYLLGGPAVHLVHRKVGTAFGSLGLRIFTPAVGAALGYAVNPYSTTGEDAFLYRLVGQF